MAHIEQVAPFLEDSLIQPSSNADEDPPPPPPPPPKPQGRDSFFVEGNSYDFLQLGHAHRRTLFRLYQENTFQASRTSKTTQTPTLDQNLGRNRLNLRKAHAHKRPLRVSSRIHPEVPLGGSSPFPFAPTPSTPGDWGRICAKAKGHESWPCGVRRRLLRCSTS